MITKIKGKNFLGPDINQTCSEKMFFVGPNRSGKTTRCNIIHLCLNGFVATAHRVNKKPSDILDQYGSGDKLTCSIEINNTEFELNISRNSEGKVSKRFRVDKKNHSEKEYMSELVLAGNPKIIDLDAFIQMSDAKKIDQLFKLYPAKVDYKQLNSDINKKETAIKRIQADIKTKKAVIKENTKSKQAIELPAGNLADVKKELEDHVIAYRVTRDQIVEIEAKEKISNTPDKPIPESDIPKSSATYNKDAPIPKGTFPSPDEMKQSGVLLSENNMDIIKAETQRSIETVEFLKKVLKVMNESGCELCTTSMVIKQEIKKYA